MRWLAALFLLFPFHAMAASDCSARQKAALSGSGIKLVSCAEDRDILWVVQEFSVKKDQLAGLTVSVYDAKSAKLLAVRSGLGEQALSFKFHGQSVEQKILSGEKPGILILAFNPPNAAIFTAFRFNASKKTLEPVDDGLGIDAGQTPEIGKDDVLIVSGSEPMPYKKRYHFDSGKFTPIE